MPDTFFEILPCSIRQDCPPAPSQNKLPPPVHSLFWRERSDQARKNQVYLFGEFNSNREYQEFQKKNTLKHIAVTNVKSAWLACVLPGRTRPGNHQTALSAGLTGKTGYEKNYSKSR